MLDRVRRLKNAAHDRGHAYLSGGIAEEVPAADTSLMQLAVTGVHVIAAARRRPRPESRSVRSETLTSPLGIIAVRSPIEPIRPVRTWLKTILPEHVTGAGYSLLARLDTLRGIQAEVPPQSIDETQTRRIHDDIAASEELPLAPPGQVAPVISLLESQPKP